MLIVSIILLDSFFHFLPTFALNWLGYCVSLLVSVYIYVAELC